MIPQYPLEHIVLCLLVYTAACASVFGWNAAAERTARMDKSHPKHRKQLERGRIAALQVCWMAIPVVLAVVMHWSWWSLLFPPMGWVVFAAVHRIVMHWRSLH